MRNKQVLFIIHRLYFDSIPKLGGVDRIVSFLKKDNAITLIEHPFDKINHPSTITSDTYANTHTAIFRTPLIWVEELIVNICWIYKSKTIFDYAIASDPLNSFSLYVLKILGRVKVIHFHSTDYSPRRFASIFLNSVYQFLYHLSLNKSDYTTVVSHRMLQYTRNKVHRDRRKKIYLLPNSPYYDRSLSIEQQKRKRFQLVMLTGIFEQQVDMNNVISFLKEIRAILPKIRLNVIGHVEETTIKLFSKNGVSKNIVFHGSLPYNEAMKKMATYYLGITSYEVLNSYTYYADSLKIREYAVAGLPIVCDTIYGTAEEVKRYGAGLVYSTTLEMVEAVETLCKDEELYRRKSLNALAWAKKMDKGRLLINFFKHI